MEIKEPYSTILYIVLGIVLAFGINGGLALALATDLPIVAVESNSMKSDRPDSFQRGDILIIQGEQSYQIGDVIVFSPPSQDTPVVHRIVSRNPDGTYQTKGDANSGQLSFEASISKGQIHGKRILIIPYLGYIKIGITDYIIPNLPYVAAIVIFVYIVYIGAGKRRK